MAKVKDEWSVFVTCRYRCGEAVSTDIVVIPGFTSEKLANEAMDSVVSACRNTHDSAYGKVIKVKEA